MSEANLKFDRLKPDEYDRAKAVLNKARHPGFVGRELFYRCATNGQAVVAVLTDENGGTLDVGVALIAKGKLQALSVIVQAQKLGVGSRLVDETQPEWVNAIMERVPWFEKRGYKIVGAPKVGQSGKMATQLMQRDAEKANAAAAAPSDGRSMSAAVAAPAPAPAAAEPPPDEDFDPNEIEDPEIILNTGLRCMRRHLEAIESGGRRGMLLVMDQAQDVAGFVRALGAVTVKRRKRADDELGGKSLEELLTEAMKSPSLRPALLAALGEDKAP